jgi:hypothetical protein
VQDIAVSHFGGIPCQKGGQPVHPQEWRMPFLKGDVDGADGAEKFGVGGLEALQVDCHGSGRWRRCQMERQRRRIREDLFQVAGWQLQPREGDGLEGTPNRGCQSLARKSQVVEVACLAAHPTKDHVHDLWVVVAEEQQQAQHLGFLHFVTHMRTAPNKAAHMYNGKHVQVARTTCQFCTYSRPDSIETAESQDDETGGTTSAGPAPAIGSNADASRCE